MKLVFVLALLAISLMSCTQRLLDFTAITTKNVDISGLTHGSRITAEDCVPMVLFFPLGLPNWKTAMDSVLEQGQGDVLVDVVATSKGSWFILGGESCVVISGTVARSPSYKRTQVFSPSS